MKLSCIPACTVSVSACHLVHASLRGHFDLRHAVEASFAHAMSCWIASRAVNVPWSSRPVWDCMRLSSYPAIHSNSESHWHWLISQNSPGAAPRVQFFFHQFNSKLAHRHVALRVSTGVRERSLLSLQPKITQPPPINLQALLAASWRLSCTSNEPFLECL